MNNDLESGSLSENRELRRNRAQAVKTAWIFGFIAVAIFAIFIGSAVIGR